MNTILFHIQQFKAKRRRAKAKEAIMKRFEAKILLNTQVADWK